MGLIRKLSNKIVFLDTAPLIYYIEEKQQYLPLLDELFSANSNGKFLFKTSVITLLEVLVEPIRQNEFLLVGQYRKILCSSPTIEVLDINIEISEKSAELRAKYGLRTPDAIQLATAKYISADYFLTNDIRLKSVKEIEVLILDDLSRT
jgi:predicted nucleic acid-binding protein